MSDQAVSCAIAQMETWIADAAWNPDPEALAQWNLAFQEAMARAEKGSGWAELMSRAHSVGGQLEVRMLPFIQQRDALKAELNAQERGSRALRGYGSGLRSTNSV